MQEMEELEEPVLRGSWTRTDHPLTIRYGVEQRALQTLEHDRTTLAVVLDDHPERLQEPDFERAWISALRVFNLFQFLPASLMVTTSGVEDHAFAEIRALNRETGPTSWGDMQPAPSGEAGKAGEGGVADSVAAWQEVMDLAQPDFHPLINILREEGTPVPEVGFDLIVDDMVCGEAELAWKEQKVAILAENQGDAREVFLRHGWTACEGHYGEGGGADVWEALGVKGRGR